MSRNLASLCLVSSLLLASACTPSGNTASSQLSVIPKAASAKPSPAAKASPAPPAVATREVALSVLAPSSLAKSGSTVVNQDPNGLIAAGGLNLISNTSVPLIAAGGLNLAPTIDALGPRFGLLAGENADKPVEKAIVTFREFTLDGRALTSQAAQTDAQGKVVLKAVVADRPLEAQAVFKIDGETYRVSAAIPAGDLGGMTTVLDPINTVVAARIRAILKANGKTNPALVFADLKNVWQVVYDAGVTVDLEMLRSGTKLEDLDAFYAKLVAQITDEAKKKVITDYMKKIREST
ncbi:MAG: hypothetical protein VKS61_10570 [Candidatus Sericytochromatia bacterium]|nr:hypothetical protein [Candidatus Sericytochromatia bacterium]